jgi:hypothetical protein
VSLTNLRGRIVALGGVIVLLLVAGVWVALTHASAQSSADGKSDTPAGHSSQSPSTPIQLVSASPSTGATGVDGAADITIKFSAPLATNSPMPTITPSVQGSWQGAGTSTLQFVPTTGFNPSTQVTVQIPGGPQGVRSERGGLLGSATQVSFQTGSYQAGRLDELLAQLGYLPLTWTAAPGATVPAANDAAGQIAAAYSPPPGAWTWESGYPSELQNFWDGGAASSEIVSGAVMAFEANQGITMDGVAGPQVWTALLSAVAAGQNNPNGYTYAIASEGDPETLTIWHDGQQVQQSLANTGIEGAPTTLGTAPVYLRYRNQIMRGINPDGTPYADPVQFVAYFRNGEAVHYFPRASYGFPQSLGCVELDLSDAQNAWQYLTYGTLVTVAPGSQTPPGSPTA